MVSQLLRSGAEDSLHVDCSSSEMLLSIYLPKRTIMSRKNQRSEMFQKEASIRPEESHVGGWGVYYVSFLLSCYKIKLALDAVFFKFSKTTFYEKYASTT